jgi:hypothetical protein
LHSISSLYPISKEVGQELLKTILDVSESLSDYEDLNMMAKRYTDNLATKLDSLPSDEVN